MTDETSQLYLDGMTIKSTETGFRMTRGCLMLDNHVTFSAVGTSFSEAICFGNGSALDDLNVNILSAADINIYGPFDYNGMN